MGWGVFTYIFGVIAIVGPLILIYWYWRAASHKLREFSAAAGTGTDSEGNVPPPTPGGEA